MTEEQFQTLPENDAPTANYKQPTEEQKMIINVINQKADEIGALFNTLKLANQVEEGEQTPYDFRFLTVAETQMQVAFMVLRRAIVNPETF